ncbi:MlaE family ABC transporter permease [Candidatus Odyssella thessalonicensis]|uniref:MlaE family ABC transporter permease n=1 Tax=Candidatus Odyssella thessalonicensis TaxID=84647 RepID=UPI000225ACB2|nr:ABC transporter permease [Candidatus Odyssella thessalonicensis]
MIVVDFLASIGQVFINFVQSTGRVGLFILEAAARLFQRPLYFHQILKQFLHIGYFSLPVVGLTAISSGMVLALQSYTGFSRFSAEGAVATVVVLSMTRELGPVLAGLMVAGRMGASMAAEIATMRVTEQLDALTTLSTNPLKYLVAPRIIAGLLMLPILVLVADVIGVMGGYLVSVYQLNFNASNYLQQTLKYLEVKDVISGLVKASVFGGIISIMGCYHGYYSGRGAEGVGRATTNAVVSASILILFMNYLLTALLFDK